MAWYDITYSCGHSGRVNLIGHYAERDRKLAWYRDIAVCPECYRASRVQQAQVVNAGLVALTGTPKQVEWAEQIRAGWMQQVAASEARLVERGAAEQGHRLAEQMRQVVNGLPEAKWWIDNRDSIRDAIRPYCQRVAQAQQ